MKTPLTAEELLKGRVGPDGTAFRDIASGDAELNTNETWLWTTAMLKLVGGEPFNAGRLDKLLEDYGAARVWFHAVWFRPRLASRISPPKKPAPLLAQCIEGDFPVRPQWANLTFSRIKHGCFTEEQRAQIPTSDSPAEWYRWLHTFGGSLDDVSDDTRKRISAAVTQGDPGVIAAMQEEFDDSATAGDVAA
jgi:hypothetical protein